MILPLVITTLWSIATALPTPDGTLVSALDRQSLLDQQCQSHDPINAQGPDFEGVQYITTGHTTASVYTAPDPMTYQYDVYRIRDIIFKVDAQDLIQSFRSAIHDDALHIRVPQGFDFYKLGERFGFKVTVTGDMNIIVFNLRECLDAMDAFYVKEIGPTVPFTQCAIHEDNYLQGKMDMYAKSSTAEECASRVTI